ncbi:MAG: hypothetical protein IJY14_03505 [Acholeplasmatales bacterium]|nr:hypothetical protein [Acholeplasmatales bacterium]
MIYFLNKFISENFIFLLIALIAAIFLSICSKKFRKFFMVSIVVGILYFSFLAYCKFYNYSVYKIFARYFYYLCFIFERIMHLLLGNSLYLRNITTIASILAVEFVNSTLLCASFIKLSLKLLFIKNKLNNDEITNDYQLLSNDEFDLKYDSISKLNTVLRC